MFDFRIKFYYWGIGILLSLIYSCSGKAQLMSNDKALVVDWDTINSRGTFLYSTLFDSVQVIILNNNSVLLGGIDRMQPYGDELFVLDSQKAKGLFVFDRKGNFIRRIGNWGCSRGILGLW